MYQTAFFYLYFLILWKLLIFDEMLMSAEIKGCIMCFIHFWILLKWGITVTHFMIVGYVLKISNIQYVGIGTFWAQKVRQEKLTKFTKVFELYQVFMCSLWCQIFLIFPIYIIHEKNWHILVRRYQHMLIWGY